VDLRRYAAEKEDAKEEPWTIPDGGRPVSERTLWRYIQQTDKMIAETCRESRKRLFRRHMASRRALYAKALNQGDVRAALACLDSEAKLAGLFDAELTQIIDQLQKEIAEIKQHYGNGTTPKPAETSSCGSDSFSTPGTAGADAVTG
jgi:hypothetical protein